MVLAICLGTLIWVDVREICDFFGPGGVDSLVHTQELIQCLHCWRIDAPAPPEHVLLRSFQP